MTLAAWAVVAIAAGLVGLAILIEMLMEFWGR